ncbi:DUF1311 domain-containing protein [Pedobacter petrophilus]|uniref:DUF1311 domain-containing protein n=2 Tax=Pedobacter petrophilus TaxID=1908241 RepID=A0A7K0G1Y9_9SPHI|nr:DUF1311 domain-containing protein [Pedobacter petrophilus]
MISLLMISLLSVSSCFAQSQTALNIKAYSDYQKADKELNIVYQKILKRYAQESLFIQKFKNAQRLWIQLRDAELDAKYPEVGTYGSVAPMCESIYLETLTRDRIKFLNVWNTGIEEGEVCLGSVKQRDN